MTEISEGQRTGSTFTQGTVPKYVSNSPNFLFILNPAFHLDHTFPRKEDMEHGKGVSCTDNFLVTKLARGMGKEESVFY